MKKLIFALLIFSTFTIIAQKYPPVTIPGSEVRNITSSIVDGHNYELHILLPSNYEKSTKKYPVVYLMDSQWDFPLVKSIYGEQYYDGFIPEIIVVGIRSEQNGKSYRSRDFSPKKEKGRPETGGANRFLDFMKTELFPFIKNNYRVTENRTLMGCSYGGLFALYTMFTHTDMFDGYAAASPGIHPVLFELEKTFAKNNTKPVSLYMTVGDVERGRGNFEKLAKVMHNSNYKNVRLVSKVLENTGHSGTKSETYSRGLQHIFERNKLELNYNILNKYVGTYKLNNGMEAKIGAKNGSLTIQLLHRYEALFANTQNHFYSTSSMFNVYFKNTTENIESFDLETFNGTQTFKKVK